jgi:hypothetical protein
MIFHFLIFKRKVHNFTFKVSRFPIFTLHLLIKVYGELLSKNRFIYPMQRCYRDFNSNVTVINLKIKVGE